MSHRTRTRLGRGIVALVLLSATGFATAAPASGAPVPSVTIGDASIVEGNQAGVTGPKRPIVFVPVTLSHAHGTVVVNYTVTGGSATSETDFVAKSGQVTFNSAPFTKYVNVISVPDTAVEGDETLTIELTSATAGFTITRATSTVTILDDDPSSGRIVSVGDVSVVEGDADSRVIRVPLTMSQSHPDGVLVNYRVDSDTATCAPNKGKRPTVAGQDCGPFGKNPAIFKPGPNIPRTGLHNPTGTGAYIKVRIFGDSDAEGGEHFTITLLSANDSTLGRAVGHAVIIDDD